MFCFVGIMSSFSVDLYDPFTHILQGYVTGASAPMKTSSNGNCFSRYCPFVRGIHRLSVNSPHKGQWRGALMFCLICAWIDNWANNGVACDLRRYRAHYDAIVMSTKSNEPQHSANRVLMFNDLLETCLVVRWYGIYLHVVFMLITFYYMKLCLLYVCNAQAALPRKYSKCYTQNTMFYNPRNH